MNVNNSQNNSKQEQRLIILDTETTGINPNDGHRIIEIGCVEMINRQLTGRTYQTYIKPFDKDGKVLEMDQGAIKVHGLTDDFLADKPIFPQIVDDFIDFIRGAELIIHNAKFDVGFINHEFSLLNSANRADHNHKDKVPTIEDICTITDTLAISKDEFGSPKSLNYLAGHYKVDKLIDRTYHGALIDAQLLAFVYIAMTRKQATLNLSADNSSGDANAIRRLTHDRAKLKVIAASADELEAHKERLLVVKQKGGEPLWK